MNIPILVTRGLCVVEVHPDNTLSVTEFGHKRMRYCMRAAVFQDCQLDDVLLCEICRLEPVVRDADEVSTHFRFEKDLHTLFDNERDKRESHLLLLDSV